MLLSHSLQYLTRLYGWLWRQISHITYIQLLCIGSVQSWGIEDCQLIQLNSDPRLWMIKCIGSSTTIAICQFDSSKWNDYLDYRALQSITEYVELTDKPISLNVRSFCQIYIFFFFSSLGAIGYVGVLTWMLSNSNSFALLAAYLVKSSTWIRILLVDP